ncbi:hypothetical protein [uncultured Bradyrhizobium sp.]|uniref:hypothetical protein n=1 Tax=uncultured Bradyrhizobium sp. TaxID=199684 RepID=UPI0035CA25E8
MTVVIVTFFFIASPAFIREGLDPSWRKVLLHARYLDLGFGNQIIYSGGPLSTVYTKVFSSHFFHERFLSITLFVVFYLAFLVNAVRRSGTEFVAIIGTTPFLLSNIPDAVYIGMPFCASMLGTIQPQQRRIRALVAVGAAASAVATLAKFTVFPVALIGFLIVDALAVSNRRFPIAIIVYALSLTAIFSLTSPNGALIEFLLGSLDFSVGYSEAMSIPGPTVEICLVLAGALTMTGLAAVNEFGVVRGGESPFTAAFARVIMIGIFLFACIKAGFVRHDVHAVIAWHGLVLASAVYCAFSWRTFSPIMAALAALALAGLLSVFGSWSEHIAIPAYEIASSQFQARKMDLLGWADFLSGPKEWLSLQEAAENKAAGQVRAQHPLPALDGTVDVIPSIQSTLIAHNLRYVPRPSIQEFATYTHRLIEKNRAFFSGERAPDFILMAPEQIDNRYPAFAEGPIWPDLLARYAPQDLADGIAVLHKRARPLDLPMRTLQTQSGTVGEPLVLDPSVQSAIFARIDLQPTLLGWLAGLLFKSDILAIQIQFTDGTERRYRFIPAMAREGFFLSPLIATGEAYIELAAGLSQANPSKVKSFTIQPGMMADWLWARQFMVRLDTMDDAALRADMVHSEMSPRARQRLELLSIMYQAPNAKLAMLNRDLFAHAPTKFSLPTNAKQTLDIGFGILDGAWRDDAKTDGVCFRVTIPGAPAPAWERCLDPMQTSADRGPQQATITLPQTVDSIELETACRNNCAWDWSYWSRISVW